MMTKFFIVGLLAALVSACTTQKEVEFESTPTSANQSHTSDIALSTPTPVPNKGTVKNAPPILSVNPSPESLISTNITAVAVSDTSVPEVSDIWKELSAQKIFSDQASHPRVKKYLARYTTSPGYFNRLIKRAELYLPYITQQLKQRKMPAELALLPFIESSYNPFAYSTSGAAGLWQFIPSTAEHMNLEKNWWYDGRRDVVASTDAALRYLSYLHQRFSGDWLLALAAYNGGEGTVSRALRKNQSKGLGTDYWSLALSSETRAYVPHFLAFTAIVAAPERHGLKLPALGTETGFKIVALDQAIDLQQVARFADIDTKIVHQLNPGFLRWASPPSGPFNILLPGDAATTFNTRIARIAKTNWLATRHHIVRPGDTLSEIAERYNMPVKAIMSVNKLNSVTIIDGQLLKIPGATRHINVAEAQPSHLGRKGLSGRGKGLKINYSVKKGDSLSRIAKYFNVAINDIVTWNTLKKKAFLQPGQRLVLYPRS